MRICKSIFAAALFFCLPILLVGADAGLAEVAKETVEHAEMEAGHGDDGHGAESGAHGLPPNAPILWGGDGPFVISSSMVVVWVVALGIIIVCQLATRKVQMVPSGLQNFVEMLVENMYSFFEDIVGKHMIKKTFWFFCTIFLFILSCNWFGLIPGMGTIGFGHADASGHFIVTEPLLRGANADLNMTSAMALLFFFLWAKWSFQEIGAGGMLGHIFSVKGHGGGFLGVFLVAIFAFVGVIEIVSICIRPVALMFRLYGNVFAGENILETVMHLGGWWFGWLLVLPFYLLELLVGLVQALVFALLTAVFTALMCEHHEEGAH
ncbi:MAG: F0F1 ATP synthase subunit A [Verrucomicrobiia bacterium]